MFEKTCCFTGHRRLPQGKIEQIFGKLNEVVDRLIEAGVDTFISGGAVGFDLMAASMIVIKREMGHPIRLFLPYHIEIKMQHGVMKKRNCIVTCF